jgi:hypothetical protein
MSRTNTSSIWRENSRPNCIFVKKSLFLSSKVSWWTFVQRRVCIYFCWLLNKVWCLIDSMLIAFFFDACLLLPYIIIFWFAADNSEFTHTSYFENLKFRNFVKFAGREREREIVGRESLCRASYPVQKVHQ